ncbi:MAG: hypothetical protein KAS53_07590 [Candidatus Cloacimonetes bacterium]|nr:hypothetical protein [Candidatus Cloacimonadota bacterium]
MNLDKMFTKRLNEHFNREDIMKTYNLAKYMFLEDPNSDLYKIFKKIFPDAE